MPATREGQPATPRSYCRAGLELQLVRHSFFLSGEIARIVFRRFGNGAHLFDNLNTMAFQRFKLERVITHQLMSLQKQWSVGDPPINPMTALNFMIDIIQNGTR